MSRFLNTIVLIAALFLSGCTSLFSFNPQLFRAADILGAIPTEHRQVLIVLADGREPNQAHILAWEKVGPLWVKKFSTMPAVVGRNGFALPGEKKEGDGHTPSGSFVLKRAFGYAPRIKTGLDYRQVTENDFWIDDPESEQYNQWVKSVSDAKSFELLKRMDMLYEYAAVIEYNTDVIVAGRGSAIFLHVWHSRNTATSGCVATSEKYVRKILKWLDLSKNPIIILNNEKN